MLWHPVEPPLISCKKKVSTIVKLFHIQVKGFASGKGCTLQKDFCRIYEGLCTPSFLVISSLLTPIYAKFRGHLGEEVGIHFQGLDYNACMQICIVYSFRS